jgi:hypothetical protein
MAYTDGKRRDEGSASFFGGYFIIGTVFAHVKCREDSILKTIKASAVRLVGAWKIFGVVFSQIQAKGE